jgi:DNA-binding response OmpR family regulator
MPDNVRSPQVTFLTVKMLIVDDDPDFRATIGAFAEYLGYKVDYASTVEQAKQKVKEAEEMKSPFTVATIDRNFETGRGGIEIPRGKEVLRYIKSSFPQVACVMISGSGLAADEVLDLRDDYDLDYYLSKNRLDQDALRKAVERALERNRRSNNPAVQRNLLIETLQYWKNTCAIYFRNLAMVSEAEALKGIDVDVSTRNQIERYKAKLSEAEDKVRECEEQLKRLG